MKLKDLKQDMVCELRNGDQITIVNNNEDIYYYKENEIITFRFSPNYNDDLTHQRRKDFDIMKVTFKRPESNLFFEPKENETYHCVNRGSIWTYENDDSEYDDKIFKSHIVFKTKEEAEKELLRQQAKIRVIKEIARLNDGWDVREHWGNEDVVKRFIGYLHSTSKLSIDFQYHKALDNNLYLKTRELAEQLIETHSDDLKLMLEVE
ncbi:MAG TPA: hypothetical protein VJZ51_05580 [Bacilli bacterium]|nr:hypothetical protein [Bacilli bacterium]